MNRNDGITLLDFDMYSNRISLYSNNKELIGSCFGLFLTIVYVIIALTLMIFFSIDVIKRADVRVYDSTLYSEEIPYINLTSKIINFAFGLEDNVSANRYIDPSIYHPDIFYIERVRNENGEFRTVSRQKLNYSRCSKEHFGKNYSNLVEENDIQNSYCLDEFNLTLAGGYKYDIMNYIRIEIVPCVNSTNNNFMCKPKNIINQYLTGTYFSMLFKDIGLNPSNYSHPVLPILQDLYATVDKERFKDIILNFQLLEIHTDTSLFIDKIKKQKYIQFLNEKQTVYSRDEEDFNSGKELCAVQIRLHDIIHLQKRNYKKIQELFSKIGGYMHIVSSTFTFISIIINKVNLEVKIMNDLFKCNFKENKITIKIRTLKDFVTLKNKDYMKKSFIKKSCFYRKLRSENINVSFNNNLSNNLLLKNNNNQKLPFLHSVSNTILNNTNSNKNNFGRDTNFENETRK